MKVKMKTTIAGPSGAASAGQVYECSDAEGKGLIDGGYAEPFSEAVVNKSKEQVVETTESRGTEEVAAVRTRKSSSKIS